MSHESQWPGSMVTVNLEEPAFKSEFKKFSRSPSLVLNRIQIHSLDGLRSQVVYTALSVSLQPLLDSYLIVEHESQIFRSELNQLMMFRDEFQKLSNGQQISRTSRLKNLDPFWDEGNQVIRVGGRLKNAQHFELDQKHPILPDLNASSQH